MARKDSLAKNTILLSIGTLLTKGLSFVMVPFFSRWLSTEDYGTFDLLCTYVTLLIPLIGLASNEALFRFSMDAKQDDEKKGYVSNCFAIFTLNSTIFFVVIILIRVLAQWHLAIYFGFLLLGEVYNLHLRGFLRAIKHLDIYSFVSAISTVFIAVFCTILIKGFGMALEGILLGYALGYIAGDFIIVLWAKYWRFFSLKSISFKGMRELVKYSYALIPNSLSWWLINVSDRTIINFFLGATANGIYAIAYKIPNILTSVFSVFSVSWQQSATEALDSSGRDKYYNNVYNKMIVILLSLGCGILSLNSWLFNYIFDAKYYSGHLYAPILIAGTVFSTLSQFYGGIQISFKQPKENGVTTVAGAVSNIVIHLLLIKFVGLYAAAISTVLSQVVVCVLRNIKVKKIVKIGIEKKTYFYVGIYLYFTAMAYYISNLAMNVINVGLASILVIWCNRDYAKKLLRKFAHK